MAVYITEGLPGNGKTLEMTNRIFNDLRAGIHVYTNVDLDVSVFDTYTPMQFKIYRVLQYLDWHNNKFGKFIMGITRMVYLRDQSLSYYYHRIYDIEGLRKIGQFPEFPQGNVYLDEIHLYFDARDWDKLDAEDRRILAQHRHFGMNIYGTTQAMGRVENILRQLCEYAYSINKIIVISIPWTNIAYGFFWIRTFRPKTLLDSAGDGKEFVQVGWGRLFVADPSLFKLYDTFQNVKRPDLEGMRVIEQYVYVRQESLKKIKVS